MANTFQTNIKEHSGDMSKYSLFLGGLNVTRDSLIQYDPLRSGYGRIFMIRQPIFVTNGLGEDKMRNFKHILEYGNTSITGPGGSLQLDNSPMTGGYVGRQVEIPTVTKDNTNDLTIQVYEFAGSPVREVLQYWITGISDPLSGYSTYHRSSALDNVGLNSSLANETAEFIYVATDNTGYNVEYACMFANCWPTEVNLDHFNYTAGQHDVVQVNIQFNATRYISPQINDQAKKLIRKYNVLMDSLNFHSGYSIDNDEVEKGKPGTFYEGRDNDNRGQIANKDKDDTDVFVETYDETVFKTPNIGPVLNSILAKTEQSKDGTS